MSTSLALRYKAELLVGRTLYTRPFRFAVNGGCDLGRHVQGAYDYVAEQIHMCLASGASITATWIPRVRNDGSLFAAAFAGYQEPNGDFFRFDNAHTRGQLHLDMNYRGQKRDHEFPVSLRDLAWVDRRRLALVQLLLTVEHNLDWRIPIEFYMPWCLYWPDQYGDFPRRLRERTPSHVPMTTMCEAIMYYASFGPDTGRAFEVGAVGTLRTADAIAESVDRVASALRRGETLSWTLTVLGHLLVVPFPIVAPPGSEVTGPRDVVEHLHGKTG